MKPRRTKCIACIALIALGLSWDRCAADEAAALAARSIAMDAEMNAMNSRDQAEWMRDDALALKTTALLTREDCVTAGATMEQLDPGDNAVDTGNLKKAVGANDYAAGSTLDAAAQEQMVFGNGYLNEERWGDATTAFNTATTKFNEAVEEYDQATSDGFYMAYEWYYTASDHFDALLMFLLM